MKKNTKKTLKSFEDSELIKRYHYLKSKLHPHYNGVSRQMKYILYHLRKRHIKIKP